MRVVVVGILLSLACARHWLRESIAGRRKNEPSLKCSTGMRVLLTTQGRSSCCWRGSRMPRRCDGVDTSKHGWSRPAHKWAGEETNVSAQTLSNHGGKSMRAHLSTADEPDQVTRAQHVLLAQLSSVAWCTLASIEPTRSMTRAGQPRASRIASQTHSAVISSMALFAYA